MRLERGGGLALPIKVEKDAETGEVTEFIGLQLMERPQVKNMEEWQAAWPNITPAMIAELGRKGWEIPRGYSDPRDKSGQDTAKRETEEETDHPISAWLERPDLNDNTAVSPHMTAFAICELDLSKTSSVVDTSFEKVLQRTTWFTTEQVAQMRNDGMIYCAYTMSAIGDYLLRKAIA